MTEQTPITDEETYYGLNGWSREALIAEIDKLTIKANVYGRKLFSTHEALKSAGFDLPHVGLGQGYEEQQQAIAAALTAERERARPPVGCVRLSDGTDWKVCSDSTSLENNGYRTIVVDGPAESARGGGGERNT